MEENEPLGESILKIASALEISPSQLFRFRAVKTRLGLDDQIGDELVGLIEDAKPTTKRKMLQALKCVRRDLKV